MGKGGNVSGAFCCVCRQQHIGVQLSTGGLSGCAAPLLVVSDLFYTCVCVCLSVCMCLQSDTIPWSWSYTGLKARLSLNY